MKQRILLPLGIALSSASTLVFELALTRILAVSEWYHLAFMCVSVALLGSAASGTLLATWRRQLARHIDALTALFPVSLSAAYLITNAIPLDTYQITWSPRQALYLVSYYVCLTIPFALGGLIIAFWLGEPLQDIGRLYGACLLGSAAGGAALLAAMTVRAEQVALGAGAVAAGAAFLLLLAHGTFRWVVTAASIGAALTLLALVPPPFATLRLSPYKSLSYALCATGARHAYSGWSIDGRVDLVESERLHTAPGLSLQFHDTLPPQHGVTIDGGDICPITRRSQPEDTAYLGYTPLAAALAARKPVSVLVLNARTGTDVAIALATGAQHVKAVEPHALVVGVERTHYADYTGNLYDDPRVETVVHDVRGALAQETTRYDAIVFALASEFRPLASGSYSLAEDYCYTVEAFRAALHHVSPEGVVVATRWLQDPPSESLRLGATIIEALRQEGISSPAAHILALRTWSTLTVLASPAAWRDEEIAAFMHQCADMGFDLVHYPQMPRAAANQRNILQEPLYHDAFQALLASPQQAEAFIRDYPYALFAPTDDQPFFDHYFRWDQMRQLVSQLGKTWQPFGGSGYLMVWFTLALASALALALVIIPMRMGHLPGLAARPSLHSLLYFGGLGMGFMMLEMPLMQYMSLYLGNPSRSFVIVLSGLLMFSGVGSMASRTWSRRWALTVLVGLIAVEAAAVPAAVAQSLGAPLGLRAVLSLLMLMPLGLLMGVPFPAGLASLSGATPEQIPWAWAINGSASVVSAILATIIALSFGYRAVFCCAGVAYAVALGSDCVAKRRVQSRTS